jgi:lysophospholipase L1-like esterase
MNSAKAFLIFDPRLYSDLEKYIWISDSLKEHREAQRFFVCLLKKGIYIKGFATDKKSMFNLKMYNKKIYDINTLNRENTIVFYDTYLGRFDVELPRCVQNARMLNPDIAFKNIIIWGSGITGRRVYKILSENGIEVACCVDSNKDLEGTYLYNLPVYTTEYLEKFEERPVIIEAMENWEELDNSIRGSYDQRFYFSFIENDMKKLSKNTSYINLMFNLTSWHNNFAFFVDKTVYIYGVGEYENELAKYLKLLDIDFGGFLIDKSEEMVSSVYTNYNVSYIEEILYEKDYFIWVYEKRNVKKLEELGLISHANYIYHNGTNNTSIKRKQILDTNLGYNYLINSKYPGILIYGIEKKKNYKIAVLGGSTTDGKLYFFKSWPQLMYEELYNKGIENITIYNGGVVEYASGQELLKLIRDVIPLKPNMIILYDGFNDLNSQFEYPLTNGYLKKIFEFAKENMENDICNSLFTDKDFSICQGIETTKDLFSAWWSNIQTMYAIAMERNISFYSFCQPMLESKRGKTEVEKNMLLSVNNPALTNLVEHSFRKRIKQIAKLPMYMHDLSYIFDNEKDIYMDHCHVLEKGNQIIAREIIKIILPELRRV